MIERLEPWLHATFGPGDIRIEPLAGGWSNLTYLVRIGARELVLRRPPPGANVAGGHDMLREWRILSGIDWHLAPSPVACCEDRDILGAPFYLMERLPGIVLRREAPADRRLGESLADALCELHALDWHRLSPIARPDGYLARQLDGWSRRWAAARTDDTSVEPILRFLWRDVPRPPAPTLIHNDFKEDNLFRDPGDLVRVVGVGDWEMATVGDPLSDLGTTLAYFVEPGDPQPLVATRFGPLLPMTRRELAERYAQRSGRSIERIDWYYVFGLFKVAVILQQIYARWLRGTANDSRFGTLRPRITALLDQAARCTLS